MNTRGPYIDSDGKPKLRTSVTGFVDVLGFSQYSTAAKTIEESQQTLDRIAAAIHESRAFVRTSFADEPMAEPTRWDLKFFSDNLAFGFPCDEDERSQDHVAEFAIRCVQHYQLHMALNGFFVRGAMTLGPICLTDEIIFGPSLIESYVLESKSAIVPRVILTKPLQELFTRAPSTSQASDEAICRDIDGWWFINYLQVANGPSGINWLIIDRHKYSVLETLAKTTAHDVLPKFGWICRYHNVFCHWHQHDPAFSERYRIDRVDEQSTIHRLKDVATSSH